MTEMLFFHNSQLLEHKQCWLAIQWLVKCTSTFM